MSTLYPFRSDSQIEKYLAQFMRAMSGFQVKESSQSQTLRRVPVRYGSMHRIIASVLQRRDSYTNNALPLIAVNLAGIEKDDERKVSHHHTDSITFTNDLDETQASNRIVGPSLNLNIDLSVYASSTSQLFEIVEQMLLIFNPRITIQVDNNIFNSDYLTEISLLSIDNEIQYPLGTEQQTVMQTLSFQAPVRIRYPYSVTDTIIKEIRNKILDDTGDNVVELSEIVIDEGDV